LHCSAQYTPDWDSLDTRPLPTWYDEAKIGIFIHWGVYSVPSFYTEWFWSRWLVKQVPEVVEFMKKNYPPDFTYPDFASSFNAEFYDPVAWAKLFQDAGAKYLVFTSKHHEGFCNWNTSLSFSWNSMALGPNRNLLGDLAVAIRENTDIKFGLYHTQGTFFHPLFEQDKANNFETNEYTRLVTIPELHELVETYKPEVVWSDGDWFNTTGYANATHFLAWLYNESPVKDTVVVNDRWGKDVRGKHGDFWTIKDRYNPDEKLPHKWESGYTLDKNSWGYVRTSSIEDYLTPEEIVAWIAAIVAKGGNVLINIGPRSDGMIEPIMEERLRQMGEWLGINGEAIYGTVPWGRNQNDTITEGVWYTSKVSGSTTTVYSIATSWPRHSRLVLGVPKPAANTEVHLLGYDKPLEYEVVDGSMFIKFPNMQDCTSQWAWTLSFTNLQN